MKKRFKYLLATVAAGFFLLLVLFAGLHFYIITTTPAATFYNSEQKLWKHAVNDTALFAATFEQYPGIEFDVNYDLELMDFDLRYFESDSARNVDLTTIFRSIPEYNNYYYWIDFKNLTKATVKPALDELNKINNELGIKSQIIIESPNIEELGKLSKAGYFISYWIPHFKFDFLPFYHKFYADYKEALKIARNIRKYDVSAISAHYPMYETMHRFFPKMNIHLWTNGLKTEEDKALIKDLAKNKNIKVIIVDYPYNFDEAASGKNNQ